MTSHLSNLGKRIGAFWSRRWLWAVAGLVLLAASWDAWKYRHQMNPDGISYLDLSFALLDGGPSRLVNGHWSPLYPVVLAPLLWIVHQRRETEFPAVHFLNVLLFLFAHGALHYLLHQLWQRCCSRPEPAQPGNDEVKGSPFAILNSPVWFLTCCHLLALGLHLRYLGPGLVSPDLLATGLFYWATGCAARGPRPGERPDRKTTWRQGLTLGCLCGLCYLAKAPFLPICASLLVVNLLRSKTVKATIALVAFGCICLGQVIPLSIDKHRVTFGDSGRLNLIWNVARFEVGTRQHPLRQVAPEIEFTEFAGPIGGTYPLWYDPSYWMEGVSAPLSVAGHWRQLTASLSVHWKTIVSLPFSAILVFMCVSGCAFAFGRDSRAVQDAPASLAEIGLIALPSSLAIAMFSAVLVEPRYVIAFWVVILCSLATISLPRRLRSPRPVGSLRGPSPRISSVPTGDSLSVGGWLHPLLALFLLIAVLRSVPATPRYFWLAGIVALAWIDWLRERLGRPDTAARSEQPRSAERRPARARTAMAALALPAISVALFAASVARLPDTRANPPSLDISLALNDAGVLPGAQIAVLGAPCTDHYWAHLASLRIAAELPRNQIPNYWKLSQQRRREIDHKLAISGVGAMILLEPPPQTEAAGWRAVRTGIYIRRVSKIDRQSISVNPDGRLR